MHLDIDDVAYFNLCCYCPYNKYHRGIDTCLNVRVETLGVSEIHGWISLSLLEER